MAIGTFLAEKLKGYSIPLLVRLEFEALFFALGSAIPTTLGMFLRAGISKLFFRSSNGFCWIQQRVTFVHTERLRVGKNLGVNSGSYINAVGGIDIGDFVLMGSNVTVSSGMHPVEGHEPPIYSRQSIPKKIIIEDDVWIGAGAVIMPGIRLAKGSVIGANAVVTRDTEPYSIYVGAPAKFLRTR